MQLKAAAQSERAEANPSGIARVERVMQNYEEKKDVLERLAETFTCLVMKGRTSPLRGLNTSGRRKSRKIFPNRKRTSQSIELMAMTQIARQLLRGSCGMSAG